MLTAAISWAKHKSSSQGLYVGDSVRVKSCYQQEAWTEAECVVTRIDVARAQICRVLAGDVDSNQGETIEIERGMLYDVGEQGLCKLLRHVQFAFISVQDLMEALSVCVLKDSSAGSYFKTMLGKFMISTMDKLMLQT